MSVTITMPQLGETVTEGTILQWVKQIGEYVAEDDILVEISTDKVDTEIPSPAEGILTEILVPAGTTVDVGTPIAILSGAASAEASTEHVEDAVHGGESLVDSDMRRQADAGTERRSVLSPIVRKLAAEHAVDLAMVAGTGDGGRITRRDVEAFVESRSAEPVLPSEKTGEIASQEEPRVAVPEVAEERRPPAVAPVAVPEVAEERRPPAVAPVGEPDVREIGHLRRRIAGNMAAARQAAAHVWTSVEVDYERVASVRRSNIEAFKSAEGFSLSYLPFIARATMEALSAYPVVNSLFDLDAGRHTFHRHVNLGIAIDLDQSGLVVANIPGADSLTLRAIARSIRVIASAARSGQLGPDDLVGYTFSITNPGPYGSFMSAPIIPPPTAAILSTDTVKKRPVVIELPDGSDSISIHHVGYLGLSWDHRVFDGSTAVLFLNRIKENLETWDWEQELR